MSGANDPTDAFKKDSPPPIDTVFPFLPGLDNVFVILRTNATETPSKLPVHFATTLHCAPHYAIYSDLAEEIAGHPIHDALDEIPPPAAISPNVLSSRPSTKAQRARPSSSRFAILDASTLPPGAASPPGSLAQRLRAPPPRHHRLRRQAAPPSRCRTPRYGGVVAHRVGGLRAGHGGRGRCSGVEPARGAELSGRFACGDRVAMAV